MADRLEPVIEANGGTAEVEMQSHAYGDYVSYHEYEELEKERDELEAKVEELNDEIRSLNFRLDDRR